MSMGVHHRRRGPLRKSVGLINPRLRHRRINKQKGIADIVECTRRGEGGSPPLPGCSVTSQLNTSLPPSNVSCSTVPWQASHGTAFLRRTRRHAPNSATAARRDGVREATGVEGALAAGVAGSGTGAGPGSSEEMAAAEGVVGGRGDGAGALEGVPARGIAVTAALLMAAVPPSAEPEREEAAGGATAAALGS